MYVCSYVCMYVVIYVCLYTCCCSKGMTPCIIYKAFNSIQFISCNSLSQHTHVPQRALQPEASICLSSYVHDTLTWTKVCHRDERQNCTNKSPWNNQRRPVSTTELKCLALVTWGPQQPFERHLQASTCTRGIFVSDVKEQNIEISSACLHNRPYVEHLSKNVDFEMR